MKPKTLKAILIDTVNRVVSEVEIERDGLASVYKLIGNDCRTVEAPRINQLEDSAYSDEDVYGKVIGGWALPTFSYPLRGNSVLVNVDRHGNTIAPKVTAAEIASSIRFFSPEQIDRLFQD